MKQFFIRIQLENVLGRIPGGQLVGTVNVENEYELNHLLENNLGQLMEQLSLEVDFDIDEFEMLEVEVDNNYSVEKEETYEDDRF